eukprot:COSAG01_NODE_57146_length_314_cov_0.716279_1_plen_72_part_10
MACMVLLVLLLRVLLLASDPDCLGSAWLWCSVEAPDAFLISGAPYSLLNGEYTKTDHHCGLWMDRKPVYQKL